MNNTPASPHSRIIARWLRIISCLSLVVLLAVLVLLLTYPPLGLNVVWNGIIPLAPLLFFLVPNLWTNMCPLAILQLVPYRAGFSPSYSLSDKQTHYLRLLSWCLLYVMVPARHVIFNVDATILAMTTLAVGMVALGCGFIFNGFSGWCMGMCPIRPVEMMYGQFNIERHRPEGCSICRSCNSPCSRLNVTDKKILQQNNARYWYFVYSFPGFVLGYYLVDPASGLFVVYGYIIALSIISLLCFRFIEPWLSASRIVPGTIILALCIYYSFTVPNVVHAWTLPMALIPTFYTLIFGVIAVNVFRYIRNS